jgi:hypothetical protein
MLQKYFFTCEIRHNKFQEVRPSEIQRCANLRPVKITAVRSP